MKQSKCNIFSILLDWSCPRGGGTSQKRHPVASQQHIVHRRKKESPGLHLSTTKTMTNTHTNTQIQRQIQERKGQSAGKAIHVAYFRNSESAKISNMIFSVHHQTIIQRQIQRQRERQRQRQRQRQSVERTIHAAYFRKAEGARISNMIFSAHHQSII